ncbi:MAG: pyrH [Candidatus Saccharibacteria bacterium]|nr:pyrH [Candidatus Saccharibacteria bacterium]
MLLKFILGNNGDPTGDEYTRGMYKRILLKLSGEQLQGQFDGGFDADRAAWIAEEIKKAQGAEIIIMIGGGNYARGAQLAGKGVQRVTADNIGMMATIMNAVALTDVFNSNGLTARALTNLTLDQVADQFTHRRALSHLSKGRVVIVAGGIGRPYLTTDTAAVSLALELECDAILKATKVDGIYDSDPAQNPNAQKITTISHQQALEQPDIKIMDKAALGLATEHDQALVVFELLKPDNIAKAIAGESIGTTIKS